MGKQSMSAPISRVDGRKKVTGAAKYFAEFEIPGMTHAVMVTSTIASGKISAVNTKSAEQAPGVVGVFTHLNMPPTSPEKKTDPAKKETSLGGKEYQMLNTTEILFSGQPIAIVVADSLERAQYAASLVTATYQKTRPVTSLATKIKEEGTQKWTDNYQRGDESAWAKATITHEADYIVPIEVHNPMELHGILAHWTGPDKVIVYAKTQGTKSTQQAIKENFGLEEKNIEVSSEFVGGGFGMALITWPQEIAVVAIARKVGRPVKLVMSRDQMFTMVGHRPFTLQKIKMGATADGKIAGMVHEAIGHTSMYSDFTESTVNMTRYMYECANVSTHYRVVPLNIGVPIWMRGPGEATGSFALETAMDEMAYKLKLDPIKFRLINYAERDPEKNLDFSSKYLREGYAMGAEKIGWYQRNPEPRSMKNGEWLVGYGMSSGTFGAFRDAATVKATLNANGSLVLKSAVTDIGPGTATTMVQIAHHVLGIPTDNISFLLGNSGLPNAPSQGGSSTVSTVGSAVFDVCTSLKRSLVKMLDEKNGTTATDITAFNFKDGRIVRVGENSGIIIADLLTEQKLPLIEATLESKGGAEQQKYSMYSFSIHFAEVRVHPTTGIVRVKRVVTVADSGTIVSPKTAASQMIGGVTGGIGMALTEVAVLDHRFGRFVNNNFADYHVPVNADVPHIETLFIDKPDPYTNPMGSKGMGEIALIGFAAAVGNAIYHATGKRIREIPITPDKLI